MAHISLVTLGVDDISRATDFYRSLGWRRSSASVEGVVSFLQGGTVALAVYGREALAQDAGVDARRGGGAGIALAMNVASEPEVDRMLRDAQDAGGRITRAAQRADWGGYSGYVADPDGHLWEVAHNPGFPLDPDGRVQLPPPEPLGG